MKDEFLSLLVNETLNVEDKWTDLLFLNHNPKNKSFSLTHKGKVIEFPENWNVFSELRHNSLVIIQDDALLSALSSFLGIELASACIGKSGNHFKMEIERAADLKKSA